MVPAWLFPSGMGDRGTHFLLAAENSAVWGYGLSFTLGIATTLHFLCYSLDNAAGAEPISEKECMEKWVILERHCWTLCVQILIKKQFPDPLCFTNFAALAHWAQHRKILTRCLWQVDCFQNAWNFSSIWRSAEEGAKMLFYCWLWNQFDKDESRNWCCLENALIFFYKVSVG